MCISDNISLTCRMLDDFISRVSFRFERDFLALNIGGRADGFGCQHSFISVDTSERILLEFQTGYDVLGRIF